MLDKDDGVWRMFSARRPGTEIWLLTALEDRNLNRIEPTYADEGARLLQVKDSVCDRRPGESRVNPDPRWQE